MGTIDLEAEFDDHVKPFYPKRAGGQGWADARRQYAKRRKRHTLDEIRDGVIRYAKWCQATGKEGTELVKQAKTFFGPGLHFQEHYEIPAGGKHEADGRTRGQGLADRAAASYQR